LNKRVSPHASNTRPRRHDHLADGSSPASSTTHSFEPGNSRFAAKRPRTGGLCRRCGGLCRDNSGVEGISAELSLALKSGFPERRRSSGGDTVRMWELCRADGKRQSRPLPDCDDQEAWVPRRRSPFIASGEAKCAGLDPAQVKAGPIRSASRCGQPLLF
jgi:hypothetical protein